MIYSRRCWLAGGLKLAITGLALQKFSPLALASLSQEREFWVSARNDSSDNVGLGWIDASNNNITTVDSAFRGHGMAQLKPPLNHAIMVSRRPGKHILEIDLLSGRANRQIECEQGRELQGHACISANGGVLFSSQIDTDTGKGRIVLYDTATFKIIGEYDSAGLEPHEVRLMPDGETLVVANGGLVYDKAGKVINAKTMSSSLAYLRASDGKLLEQTTVAEPKASIRHLDIASDGTVVFSMQVQRDAMAHSRSISLGALHRRGEAVRLLQAPDALLHRLHDYTGSVAINNRNRLAGLTSPRGDLAVFWNIDTSEIMGWHPLHDVCGITVSSDEKYFILSNSSGMIRQIVADSLLEDKSKRLQYTTVRWDNHLTRMTLPI